MTHSIGDGQVFGGELRQVAILQYPRRTNSSTKGRGLLKVLVTLWVRPRVRPVWS